MTCGFFFSLACATSAQLFQRLSWFLYAVCHFFDALKFDRMFQLPLCFVYVACLALFSQISLVQSLKFFDVSSLPFWQYTALFFDGKKCPHTQTPRLACTVVVTLRTYLLQTSIALHRSAPSAYNARNVRVLIASSKKYLHQKRPEVCSSAALTNTKSWPLNSATCGEKHVIICATFQNNIYVQAMPLKLDINFMTMSSA